MLRVGVISYLPNNDIRDKRLTVVRRSLMSLRSLIPSDVIITVIAQNYCNGEEFDGSDGFNYHHYTEGIGQCAARNHLLTDFYNSDDDFMLYTDDDASFYDRYGACKLFNALHSTPEWFDCIDCFTGIEGRFTPFTAENEKLGLEDKWVFKPMQFATSGEFRVLRNLKKYYGKEFYYDSDLVYGEDLHFRLTKLSQINSFVCRNLILNNRGMVTDICTLDRMTKQEQERRYTQVTKSVYDMLGITVDKNGKPDLSKYRCKIPYLSINMSNGSCSTKSGPKPKPLF